MNNNDLCAKISRKSFECGALDDYPFFEHKTSMLSDKNDPKSVRNLEKLFSKEICRQFHLANEYHSAIFEIKQDMGDYGKNISVAGEACKRNQSLLFVVMDSLNYYHFAEKLGVHMGKNRDKSAAIIINDKVALKSVS